VSAPPWLIFISLKSIPERIKFFYLCYIVLSISNLLIKQCSFYKSYNYKLKSSLYLLTYSNLAFKFLILFFFSFYFSINSSFFSIISAISDLKNYILNKLFEFISFYYCYSWNNFYFSSSYFSYFNFSVWF
jgi:hypothetical protein